MPSHRTLTVAAAVLGVAFVYFAEPAKSLPLPDFLGHQAGSNHHHVKHGIASLLLGIACFVFAWFQSGPRATQSAAR